MQNTRKRSKSIETKKEGDAQPELLVESKSKWTSFVTRTIWTVIMILGFLLLLATDHIVICILVIFIQMLCFQEVVSLGYEANQERKMPLFRLINYYFLFSGLYFCYGKQFCRYFAATIKDTAIWALYDYHFFISFVLYIAGFVGFVLSLKKGMYKYQFSQMAKANMTILLVVGQSNFVVNNILNGLFWFILPVFLVVINDIMAYICGFFMGRTPLIKLSPKKTWEGFIGGFIFTVIFGMLLAPLMAESFYLICPKDTFETTVDTCDLHPVFLPKQYMVPEGVAQALGSVGISLHSITMRPMFIHCFAMACFASIIAPFGGFFASGFKRAFNIKDFGSLIPGHGGITDRMDCQFMTGLFVYVYTMTFVFTGPPLDGILKKALLLPPVDQMKLVEILQQNLARGMP